MFIQRIVEAQVHDEFLEKVKAQLVEGEVDENWSIHVDGVWDLKEDCVCKGMWSWGMNF